MKTKLPQTDLVIKRYKLKRFDLVDISSSLFDNAVESLRNDQPKIGNLVGSAFALFLSYIYKKSSGKYLALVSDFNEAINVSEDLTTFLGKGVLFPDVDGTEPEFFRALSKFKAESIGVISTSLFREISAEKNPIKLKIGETVILKELLNELTDHNYERISFVESPGQFAVRGSVLDIFSLSSEQPTRIELFGDKIESIRMFDVSSQNSLKEISECEISRTQPEKVPLIDLLPDDIVIFLREAREFNHPAKLTRKFVECSSFAQASGINMIISPCNKFSGSLSNIGSELANIKGDRFVFAPLHAEANRLADILQGIDFNIILGSISSSFVFDEIGKCFISGNDLLNRYKLHRKPVQAKWRQYDESLELKQGDYVVHRFYGIGQFSAIQAIDGKDVATIEYSGGTKLHLPIHDLHLLQKYVGFHGQDPKLDSLSGDSWLNSTIRAEHAVQEFAKELVSIQAKRELLPGTAFPEDTDWQMSFEASFPYQETQDQIDASDKVKKDMCTTKPMDRLLCGDVGFGKTEIAMRAAFKSATSGMQVAVLAPTTILASQHYKTFKERMAAYPLEIESLSRFKTDKEQKEILARLENGSIDIIIGTHRLLQPDVNFKDLGLVIIDEEQRFGVLQKERFKKMRATVDILTLTATPIPRTLHMALLQLKDVSLLATAPQERLPIRTMVHPFDETLVRDAITHELDRGGQVFFVHNRVYNIIETRQRIERLVPNAIMKEAHGQMSEGELEETMIDFLDKKIDVLVTTTIIENGVDIPNVNTLIVNNADQFGLSDLHQLRGRVGRYNRQAYAYFLIPRDRPLTPEAKRRLEAIEEFSHLGAGFKLALQDMEIRGAGNVLGKEQHGRIREIGYELYIEILDRETRKLKKLPVADYVECSVNLAVKVGCPPSYSEDSGVVIELYRLVAKCKNLEELENARIAIKDRFGALCPEIENLFKIKALKMLGSKLKFQSITETDEYYILKYLDKRMAWSFAQKREDRVRIVDKENIYVLKEKIKDIDSLINLFSCATIFA